MTGSTREWIIEMAEAQSAEIRTARRREEQLDALTYFLIISLLVVVALLLYYVRVQGFSVLPAAS
jgi:hypothetical protein